MLHFLFNQALTQIATHEGTKYIFANVLRERLQENQRYEKTSINL